MVENQAHRDAACGATTAVVRAECTSYIAAVTPPRALVDYGGDYWALTGFGSTIAGKLWAGFFDRISASTHFWFTCGIRLPKHVYANGTPECAGCGGIMDADVVTTTTLEGTKSELRAVSRAVPRSFDPMIPPAETSRCPGLEK